MEGIILRRDANSIRFRRIADGKEFDLELSKLSADDQAFVASLKSSAAPMPPFVSKLKVLYVLEPQAVVSDYYTIDALTKLGYEVTLASYKIPPGAWIVNAEERAPSLPSGAPADENLYALTTKRLEPSLKAILFENVKPADYDILFVNISMYKKETEITRKWLKAFAEAKKPTLKRSQKYYKMIGRRGTLQHNFILEENDVVLYNDDFEYEGKSPERKDENGNYDPGITKKLLILLRKILGNRAPAAR
jgi:hypothetical protein